MGQDEIEGEENGAAGKSIFWWIHLKGFPSPPALTGSVLAESRSLVAPCYPELLLYLFAQLRKQQQTLTPEQEGARFGRRHCSVTSMSLCADKDLQLLSCDCVMDSTDCQLFLQQSLTYSFLPKDLTIYGDNQIGAQ